MDTFVYKTLSIDFDSRLISQDGVEFTLDPKAFNTLVLLIKNRDRVVTNDELIKVIWNDRPTNNDVVTASIGRVRKLFKDAGVNSEVIRTAHKVGYQFVLKEAVPEQVTGNNSGDFNIDAQRRLKYLIRINLVVLSGLLLSAVIVLVQALNPDVPNGTETAFFNESAQLNTASTTATKPTEIFFIRHAEKEVDDTDDPPLSPLGITRAKRWRTLFESVDFDYIYTTRFIRNTQTVDHVFGKNIDNLRYYSALSFDIAVELQKFSGKKIAIIGHSNTIPGMVNRLVTDHEYDAMDFRNYELIYQVVVDSSGGASANPLVLDYILD